MRRWIVLTIIAAAALAPAVASAQDAEAMRKELEQMRKQFESMKESYEKSINNLSERLQKIEQAPPAAAVAPAPAAPGGGSGGAGRRAGHDLRAACRRSWTSPARASPSRSTSAAGPASSSSTSAWPATSSATSPRTTCSRPRAAPSPGSRTTSSRARSSCRLFGQIDPYARAEVRFEAGQESRGQEISVSLAEANLTLMALPFNTQAKLGMMRNRFGLTNQIHEHDLPFIDRPDVLRPVLR